MMEGSPVNPPDKVEEIFRDFRGRRAGLIKALTTDFRQLYQQCDPENPESLCLYGFQNETWVVCEPTETVPVDYPEPALGINFTRDVWSEKDWKSFVAARSDSWLIAVAFFSDANSRINKTDRNRLFQMINDLPTIYEVMCSYANQPSYHSGTHNSSSQSESSRKTRQSKNHTSKPMKMTMPPKEDEHGVEEYKEDEDHDITICGACREMYIAGEFWICCDTCEEWFHGACVRITPEQAKHIEDYKCPRCSKKRTRD